MRLFAQWRADERAQSHRVSSDPIATMTICSAMKTLNVLGSELVPCSYDPLTGYFRDGCCNTNAEDHGTHVICAKLTQEFLLFSLERGNDLITPRPEYRFTGLRPGDRWCLCVLRWKEAFDAGLAPGVVLESCHAKALDYVSLADLQAHALLRTQPHAPPYYLTRPALTGGRSPAGLPKVADTCARRSTAGHTSTVPQNQSNMYLYHSNGGLQSYQHSYCLFIEHLYLRIRTNYSNHV